MYHRTLISQPELEEQICRVVAVRCKNNRVKIVGDVNFPNSYLDFHNGLNGTKFVNCVQECFLKLYADVSMRDGATFDLLLEDDAWPEVQV